MQGFAIPALALVRSKEVSCLSSSTYIASQIGVESALFHSTAAVSRIWGKSKDELDSECDIAAAAQDKLVAIAGLSIRPLLGLVNVVGRSAGPHD